MRAIHVYICMYVVMIIMPQILSFIDLEQYILYVYSYLSKCCKPNNC